jgi:hypothetical protein
MARQIDFPQDPTIRFEIQNSKPVDLFDLTSALSAFGEAYQDHIIQSGIDLDRDHLRLYVKEKDWQHYCRSHFFSSPNISNCGAH